MKRRIDLLQWLQPTPNLCIVCGHPNLHASASNALNAFAPLRQLKLHEVVCKSCLNEIAWIDKILCKRCGRRDRCPDCSRREESALWMNRSAVFYSEAMKQWLHRYKFQGDERLSSLFGKMLMPAVERVTMQLIYKQGLEEHWRKSNKTAVAWLKGVSGRYWDAVTSVPLSEERYRERGFNQAQQLAACISAQASIPYYELLFRTQQGVRHSQQSRQARLSETGERFSGSHQGWNAMLRSIGRSKPLHILLVDDVYTTGSTVHACAEALMRVGGGDLTVASITWARS